MTTYYVDFATGSDTNTGLTTTSALKHAPGDSNAIANASKVALAGGDTVLFKAGVVYQGQINLSGVNGASGKPILYEGTGWGAGSAIINGQTSYSVTFTQDPNNASLSDAVLPVAISAASAGSNVISVDGKVQYLSTSSTIANPMFADQGGTMIPQSEVAQVGTSTTWTITDAALAKKVAALTPGTLANTTLNLFGGANWYFPMTITGVNAATNTVTVSGSYAGPNPAGEVDYYLTNNPSLIGSNAYSEYAIEGNNIVAAVTPGVHNLAVSSQMYGIDISGSSNITVDGFSLNGQGGYATSALYATGSSNIIFSNNTVSNTASAQMVGAIDGDHNTNITIKNNKVSSVFNTAGIFSYDDTNALITGNTIVNPGATGINIYSDKGATVSFNSLTGVNATHAQGIAVYDLPNEKNVNVSVKNNQINGVTGGGITFRGYSTNSMTQANNLSFTNNIIQNAGGYAIADFGYTNGAVISGNILLTANSAITALDLNNSSQNISYKNNIVQDLSWLPPELQGELQNNVAITPSSFVYGNNRVDTTLASVLSTALAQTSGTLPSSIGNILSPNVVSTIGIAYTTTGGSTSGGTTSNSGNFNPFTGAGLGTGFGTFNPFA